MISQFDDMISDMEFTIERDGSELEILREKFIINQFFNQGADLKKNEEKNYILKCLGDLMKENYEPDFKNVADPSQQ